MHPHCKRLGLLLSISFLSGSSACKGQKNDFNAYLPPSSQEYERVESQPIETPKEILPDVWDLSDTDVSHIDPERKLIAFTFDDGPSKTMENILAVFAEHNESNPTCTASATFFLNGLHLTDENAPLLHTALLLGSELGNHTHFHKDLTKLSPDEALMEIERTDQALSRFDGKALHLLRPPFGAISAELKAQLKTPVINWTIDTLDWTGSSADDIYNSVYTARFSGAIVLMHDGHPATVNALKRLLPDLQADGYQVVSVSALAKAHGCNLHNGKEYIRARKQK